MSVELLIIMENELQKQMFQDIQLLFSTTLFHGNPVLKTFKILFRANCYIYGQNRFSLNYLSLTIFHIFQFFFLLAKAMFQPNY